MCRCLWSNLCCIPLGISPGLGLLDHMAGLLLLGKVVIHLQETETRSMSITLYYYQLKMDEGP
jgi:hypothetical protein